MADEQLTCPKGHTGPWRYVEAIEVWRDVESVGDDGIKVNAHWQTGEGYDTGVPGSAYLLCWATEGGVHSCLERVELPEGVEAEFVL